MKILIVLLLLAGCGGHKDPVPKVTRKKQCTHKCRNNTNVPYWDYRYGQQFCERECQYSSTVTKTEDQNQNNGTRRRR